MNEILAKEEIAPGTYRFVIAHPKLARKRRAGQFVILRVHEGGELDEPGVRNVFVDPLSNSARSSKRSRWSFRCFACGAKTPLTPPCRNTARAAGVARDGVGKDGLVWPVK